MKDVCTTAIGRLRVIGILEGISLLVLICVGVPLKYMMGEPELVQYMGPVHGALFLLFIFLTISVATEYRWKRKTIVKVVLACFIPFGTFYIDRMILSKMHRSSKSLPSSEIK